MRSADTIVALATPPGRGGVGVVRVSGGHVQALMDGILGKRLQPRTATLCTFNDAAGGTLDFGIALYFPNPHSYTGEDVLELQGHGGHIVQNMVLERCIALGARLAEPGEFTRRAFLNDKIDLAQAESVADLIDASTQSAAKSAMRSLQGEFSDRIRELVEALINLRMLVEAGLDFPEEEVDFLAAQAVGEKIAAIVDRLDRVTDAARQGCLLRAGVHVVLAGRPNVGKSSLLNRLSGDEVAIVTEVPGTTRDVIRQSIQIEGVPLHIIDTAGLRESADPVEKIGMERSRKVIRESDLILFIAEASRGLIDDDVALLDDLPDLPTVVVYNKIDQAGVSAKICDDERGSSVHLSAKTGEGLEMLRKKLLALVSWHSLGEDQFIARQRHVAALMDARASLVSAVASVQPEMVAEDLRQAQTALSSITGEFSADDLLGEIFSRFCIGK